MIKAMLCLTMCVGCWEASGVDVKYPDDIKAVTGSTPGQEKGRVVGSGWGHYLPGMCDRAATEALTEAAAKAKQMGATHLGNIKWLYGSTEYSTPVCSGMFLLYWWGASASMSATAMTLGDGTAAPAGAVPAAVQAPAKAADAPFGQPAKATTTP